MVMNKLAILGVLALVASSGAAVAQPASPPPGPPPGFTPPPPPAPGPSMALALEAAQTAVATCAGNGYKVTAVVVNSAGAPRLALMNDGAPDMTGQIAIRKAFTAMTLNEPTAKVSEQVKTDTALADRIKNDNRMITWAGGQPLTSGGKVIGAIAVSGAPGGDKDDVCTSAGVAKIKDRL
jgi:uncharacterized protein GlcG (DUF336 family)